MGEGEYVPLEAQPDGSLTGTLKVQEEGYYQVDLAMADGTFVEASPQYTIDLLSDAPPAVRFTTPGRDSPASPIEEVYLEAQADDDYGVDQLLLVYSVNGEAEDTVALHAGGRPLTEVTAGHTLYLEEFEVEPGDVVSYYGVARDRQGRATEAVSDIYFVNVQPFGRDFKEGEQQGGPPQGGQGAGAGNQAELSQLQRQVIAATFNLNRDRDRYSDEEFGESTVSVALAQGRVREQVSTLVERMTNRGLAEAEDQFKEIAEMLPEAMEAMETAEADLRDGKTRDALSPEQQALRVLQKAEETYERYVTNQQQSGGGGGGGGNQANAEDLADLFELELDKLENQYETVQRGERQQANAEVDEVLEKLDELARRQQAEGERQRARAQQGQTSSGGQSAAGQRELADQAEEAARQLQRLARQNGDQQLDEAARRLQEAAQAMRNAAARGGNAGVAESARALDRLQDAQRRLQRARENRVTEDAQNALDRVERLQQEQAEISRAVEDMPEDPSARTEVVERLKERKTSMAEEVGSLQRDMKRLSADARQEDPEAARAIDDAANAIEEGNLTAKILYSRGVVEQREKELARVFERGLEEDLEALRKKVENAAKVAQGLADAQGMEEALDRAQDLVQGVESLNERMQNRDRGEERDSLAEGGAAGQRRLGDRPGEQGEQQQGQGGQQQGQQGGQQQGQQGSQQQGQQGGQQQGQQGGQQQGQQGGQQQGQGGQQGGQQQGGQQGRGGNADVLGGSFNGGATRGSPRPYTDEEIRQFRREFQQRYADAQALRDALRQQGQDTQDLDRALDALRQLQVDETYGDLPQIAALRGQLTESLGRLEFSLRRQVEGEDTGRAALRGSDDVPPGFRKLVEEYYRALARGNGNGGGGQR